MEKEIIAKLKNLRIAPRKVRLVADSVRGKDAKQALILLRYMSKKAAQPMGKLLHSAVANAKNNFQLDDSNLYISKITVDEGPKLKRWRARAMGRAFTIQKKTSHINLVLKERESKTEKETKKEKIKK
jgi:large subunit ribosomal protein L22